MSLQVKNETTGVHGYVSSTNPVPVTLSTQIAGEDQEADVLVTMPGGPDYETVAASQTDQALGATGAVGDYLGRLVCVVATAATAQVQIKDGSGSAITVLPNSPGGGVGTYVIDLGIKATGAGWKVTTGAGVTVIACGAFT